MFKTNQTNSSEPIATRIPIEKQLELLNHLQSMFSKATGQIVSKGITKLDDIATNTVSITNIDANPINDEDIIECCICMELLQEEDAMIFKSCKHVMCDNCTKQLFRKTTINIGQVHVVKLFKKMIVLVSKNLKI